MRDGLLGVEAVRTAVDVSLHVLVVSELDVELHGVPFFLDSIHVGRGSRSRDLIVAGVVLPELWPAFSIPQLFRLQRLWFVAGKQLHIVRIAVVADSAVGLAHHRAEGEQLIIQAAV